MRVLQVPLFANRLRGGPLAKLFPVLKYSIASWGSSPIFHCGPMGVMSHVPTRSNRNDFFLVKSKHEQQVNMFSLEVAQLQAVVLL